MRPRNPASAEFLWQRLFALLANDPDFEYLIVDSTIVRAHQHAAGAKTSIRYDKVVDGIDALPDERSQERKNRNGAPRSGLQYETGDAHSGGWRIDGGDPSMRRVAQANWSRLPDHKPPRFYTAWVKRVGLVMSAVCPVYPKQQTFPDPVGTSHLCHKRTSSPSRRLDCRLGPGARNGRADH